MAMRDAIQTGLFGEDDESLLLMGRPDADDENDAGTTTSPPSWPAATPD